MKRPAADEDSDLDVPLSQISVSKKPQPQSTTPVETPTSATEPHAGRASRRAKTESRGVGARPTRLSAQKNKLVTGVRDASNAKRARDDDTDYKDDEDDEDDDDEDEEPGDDDSDWSPSEGSPPRRTASERRRGKAAASPPPSASRRSSSNGSKYIAGGVPPSGKRKSSTRATKRAKAAFRSRPRSSRAKSEEVPDSEEADEQGTGVSSSGRSRRQSGTAEARRAEAKRRMLDAQVFFSLGPSRAVAFHPRLLLACFALLLVLSVALVALLCTLPFFVDRTHVGNEITCSATILATAMTCSTTSAHVQSLPRPPLPHPPRADWQGKQIVRVRWQQ